MVQKSRIFLSALPPDSCRWPVQLSPRPFNKIFLQQRDFEKHQGDYLPSSDCTEKRQLKKKKGKKVTNTDVYLYHYFCTFYCVSEIKANSCVNILARMYLFCQAWTTSNSFNNNGLFLVLRLGYTRWTCSCL